MKARLKNGSVVALASEIHSRSGYGMVRFCDVAEFIQEPYDVAMDCVIGTKN